MKKIIIVAVIVLAIGGFIVFQKSQSSSDDMSTLPSTTPNNSQTNLPLASGTPPTGGTTSYKDGSYTGSIGSASQYGDIQVKVVIKSGKIIDVQFLKFPSGSGHTNEVTAMAEPVLKQEVIAAQSANIDVVSGATQDTQGFIQSLQSALDQAKG